MKFRITYCKKKTDIVPPIEYTWEVKAMDLITALAEFEIHCKKDFNKFKILSVEEVDM